MSTHPSPLEGPEANNFGPPPMEESDSERIARSKKEQIRLGQYSLTPAEEEATRKEAIARGQDPEEALRLKREKMRAANDRRREQDREGALRNIKKTIQ